jgi:hypothetical protein
VGHESIHAAFPLLKVHGIRRQIPMNDGVAVEMKVEPFLADRR